jgi:16S rRNA processing protein RimM
MSSTSSKTEGRTDLPETIVVGRVLRPHGLRGELVVEVLSDVVRRFAPGSSLLLARDGATPVPVEVAASRSQGGAVAADDAAQPRPSPGRRPAVVLRFAGVEDRDRAEELRGAWLEVERSRVPPAPAGTYYHFQLEGCRCLNRGEDLGEVVRVVEDGGGLLLVVSDGRSEVPVPFVARFLVAVDVERGRIELDLPPGLVEICASRS